MTREEFHIIAFVDFVRFAASQPAMINAYYDDTGDNYAPPTNALDRAFDAATGRTKEFIRSFMEWCAGQYGREHLPPDFLDRILDPA